MTGGDGDGPARRASGDEGVCWWCDDACLCARNGRRPVRQAAEPSNDDSNECARGMRCMTHRPRAHANPTLDTIRTTHTHTHVTACEPRTHTRACSKRRRDSGARSGVDGPHGCAGDVMSCRVN